MLTPFNTTYVQVESYPIHYRDNDAIPVVVLHGVASSSPKMVEFSDWISSTFNRTVFNRFVALNYIFNAKLSITIF